MKEIKLKWSQSKLKTEMDLQKETQLKLDKALVKCNRFRSLLSLNREKRTTSIVFPLDSAVYHDWQTSSITDHH